MVDYTLLISKWKGQGDNVILHRLANRGRYRCVKAECLSHNSVEIRESAELFHCWIVSRYTEQFIPEFDLRIGRLCEGEKSPCCRYAKIELYYIRLKGKL